VSEENIVKKEKGSKPERALNKDVTTSRIMRFLFLTRFLFFLFFLDEELAGFLIDFFISSERCFL
jgi:hypothetical protein